MLRWKWLWPVAGSLALGVSAPAWTRIHAPPGVRSVANPAYSLDTYTWFRPPWYSDTPPHGHDAPVFGAAEIGDVTGDGRNDLVAVGQAVSHDIAVWDQLHVYAQRADGTLAPPVRYPAGSGEGRLLTALGDFNEDGVQDVVLRSAWTFTLYVSDGDGGLTGNTWSIYDPVELGPRTPAVPMDVNLDGHLDLVILLSRTHAGASAPSEETHSRMVVHFGDGLGGFAGRMATKTFGDRVTDVEKRTRWPLATWTRMAPPTWPFAPNSGIGTGNGSWCGSTSTGMERWSTPTTWTRGCRWAPMPRASSTWRSATSTMTVATTWRGVRAT